MYIKLPFAPFAAVAPFMHRMLTRHIADTSGSGEIPPTGLSARLLAWAHSGLNVLGLNPQRTDLLDRLLIFAAILLVAYLLWLLCRHALIPAVGYLVKHSRIQWDGILFNHHFFHRICELLPPITIFSLLPLAFSGSFDKLTQVLGKILTIYFIVVAARILTAFVISVFEYYFLRHKMESSPYKSAIEMSKIFIKTLMILCIIGILLDLNFSGVVTGLSAFAALLVLVFKDTLLGFIAGMQLLQNKMIKMGDWIAVTGTPANGIVEEINILTVRVRNFDNTFIFVPAYTLVTNAFQNWAGMKQSGMRRVDKIMLIDLDSIHPTSDDECKDILADDTLRNLLTPDHYDTFVHLVTQPTDIAGETLLDSNVRLFRNWSQLYLSGHPMVSADPYTIIRMQPSNGKGFPIELLFFIKTTVWKDFESTQSQIMEQLLIILPHFHLRPFQLVCTTEEV